MKSKRKLRVFEAFAGIGAQAAALKKLNIDYEIVGISDWFIDAIECYATIHCESKVVDVPKGNQLDWSGINVAESSTALLEAEVFFYSEFEPADEGNYWHFVDGVITKW